jgi:hypothetical protein
MQTKTVLKSLTNLFLKLAGPQAAKPVEAAQTPDATSEQQLRQALLLIEAEENSAPQDYRHWGLNE